MNFLMKKSANFIESKVFKITHEKSWINLKKMGAEIDCIE